MELAWDLVLLLFPPESSDEPPELLEALFWAEFLPDAVF
jgi:hypothetical protein